MRDGSRLLRVLLKVSEKAANIARACRRDRALFELLVEEKLGADKNPRFFRDFKTLADVLIQETIRHDIGLEFPELAGAVRGEENNVFSNTLGETITVEVGPSSELTAALLRRVLDDDQATAELLAREVHRDIVLGDVPLTSNAGGKDDDSAPAERLPVDLDLDATDLGIWIDPIDSTADYINGGEVIDDVTGAQLSGLRCVTVLIGAYFISSGLPVMGVVNQPFFSQTEDQWKGVCYWGYANGDTTCCSIEVTDKARDSKIILVGRFERPEIKSKLEKAGYVALEVAGAGYKLMSVALGRADAYVLSKASTYRWDICGPHAILCSQSGGLVDYRRVLADRNVNADMRYSNVDTKVCNEGGLIAFRKRETLDELLDVLCERTAPSKKYKEK